MFDVNTPVTNPRLKELLHQLSVEQTEDTQNLALEEIALHAHFFRSLSFRLCKRGTRTAS